MKTRTYLQAVLMISLMLFANLGCEQDTGPEEAGAGAERQRQQQMDEQPQQMDRQQDRQQQPMNQRQTGKQQQSRTEQNGDVDYAKLLWEQIKDYQTWTVPEGFEGWQDGVSPHGKILRYYINDTAAQDLTANAAVIVKENYTEKSEDALESITIMQKRTGYDPETENWFYVKYAPDGTIMENDKGMKLAGLLGKGQAQGCIPCHATAGGNDYLFMNDNDPNSQQ